MRRYYRPDLAFFTGLLFAASPWQVVFARNGGYTGSTLTLLLAFMLSALMVSVDGRRWAWALLGLCMLVMPFMILGVAGSAVR